MSVSIGLGGIANAAETVRVSASDGHGLEATLHIAHDNAPAVLMLHQCNMDRHAWDSLGEALSAAGINSLAADHRGYGGSAVEGQSDEIHPARQFGDKFNGDAATLLDYLKNRPEVNGERVAVIGASCGGALAYVLAAANPNLKGMVLFSPFIGDPWTGDDWAEAVPGMKIPIMGIAAQGDEGAYKRAVSAVEASTNHNSKAILFKGDLHGVPLLDFSPRLTGDIVAWVRIKLSE